MPLRNLTGAAQVLPWRRTEQDRRCPGSAADARSRLLKHRRKREPMTTMTSHPFRIF
jgi:hypothetical protein